MKSIFVKTKTVKRQDFTNVPIFLQIGSGKNGIETRAYRKQKYWEMRKLVQKVLMVLFNSQGTIQGQGKNVTIKGAIFVFHCKSLN